ncbi:MAG: hypothetical protein IPL65_08880 [Lewinellaceae bacterium]|nr:hypothetical protein [Lewinellaceae bacterium]
MQKRVGEHYHLKKIKKNLNPGSALGKMIVPYSGRQFKNQLLASVLKCPNQFNQTNLSFYDGYFHLYPRIGSDLPWSQGLPDENTACLDSQEYYHHHGCLVGKGVAIQSGVNSTLFCYPLLFRLHQPQALPPR